MVDVEHFVTKIAKQRTFYDHIEELVFINWSYRNGILCGEKVIAVKNTNNHHRLSEACSVELN